jgi:hypothetical protein
VGNINSDATGFDITDVSVLSASVDICFWLRYKLTDKSPAAFARFYLSYRRNLFLFMQIQLIFYKTLQKHGKVRIKELRINVICRVRNAYLAIAIANDL